MYSEPQERVVRGSRRWALVASMLVAGGLGAGEAWADIEVHVMNCSKIDIEVQAFDANDSMKVVAASSSKLSAGESGQLHCAGEGEGYCQMVLLAKGTPSNCNANQTVPSAKFHLDSGKWAVLTGYTVDPTDNDACMPDVERNLDSAPSSC